MAREKFKDETINGMRFRIGLPSAVDGSWIASLLVAGSLLKVRDNHQKAQAILLSNCQYLRPVDKDDPSKGEMPQKVYGEGRWLIPDLDLETDTDTVWQLFDTALEFAVGPTARRYLEKLEKAAAEAQNTPPPNSPTA